MFHLADSRYPIGSQYNVQFYNQGIYTNCESLISKSGGAFPGSSLFEIPKHGVSLNKLVIGKPATSADASNGYMSPATLASCVNQAHAKGWKGGVMVWQVCCSLIPVVGTTFSISLVSLAVPPRQRWLDQDREGQALSHSAPAIETTNFKNDHFPLTGVARIHDRHDHTQRRTSLYLYFTLHNVLRL